MSALEVSVKITFIFFPLLSLNEIVVSGLPSEQTHNLMQNSDINVFIELLSVVFTKHYYAQRQSS